MDQAGEGRSAKQDRRKRSFKILEGAKKNIQRKQGLKMTNKLDEIISASKDNFKVAQLYMKNTYLINKRKLNLRIYLLIVCKDNKMTAYVNKEGKCLYTNKDYNDSDQMVKL